MSRAIIIMFLFGVLVTGLLGVVGNESLDWREERDRLRAENTALQQTVEAQRLRILELEQELQKTRSESAQVQKETERLERAVAMVDLEHLRRYELLKQAEADLATAQAELARVYDSLPAAQALMTAWAWLEAWGWPTTATGGLLGLGWLLRRPLTAGVRVVRPAAPLHRNQAPAGAD